MSDRVLVTPRSMTSVGVARSEELAPLRDAGFELISGPPGRQPTRQELLDLVPGCVAWIAGTEQIDSAVLRAGDRLQVVSRYGVGVDAVDLDAALERGIVVERTVGANAQAVAELALAFVLMGLRGIAASARSVRQGGWERAAGKELAESAIGIVGLGAVGRRLAEQLLEFGSRVIAYDPFVAEGAEPKGVEMVSLPGLFSASDVVSIHRPPTPGEPPFVSGGLLQLMPPGAALVNTSRSSLVDESAVLRALENGRLASYFVDAFDTEPPEQTPLLQHPSTLATAHIGAATRASSQRMGEMAVEAVLRQLRRS